MKENLGNFENVAPVVLAQTVCVLFHFPCLQKMSYKIYCFRNAYFTTKPPLSPSLLNVNILKIEVYGYSNKKKNGLVN